MMEHVELKAWVHDSESYDLVSLTKSILRSFCSPPKSKDLEILQRQLQLLLMGKKYLLVLDCVYKRNGEFLEQLLFPFNHGSSQGKIIVTTHDKEVASIMRSTRLLDLKQLEESGCTSLFVSQAFHDRNASQYPNLEIIGKKIVDKCGGLPLTVTEMGNLLRRRFSKCEWVKIVETDLRCLAEFGFNMIPILRMSYLNLSSNLKHCFAYCSIFPKGYEFEKGELIKLWMTEGLLKCCGRDKSEEELGNELFDDLVSISFFQRSVIMPR